MNDNARRDFMKRFAATAALTLPVTSLAEAAEPPAAKAANENSLFFNVRAFGAIGDGKTVSTAALQKTVDACAQAGGGKVIVPAGRYLTGPIFLKSNVHVEVLAGAVLLFTTDLDSVPSVQGRWEGIDRVIYASLFTGTELENVSITGRGTLDGQGEAWWKAFQVVKDMRKRLGLTEREPENPPGSPLKWARPRMINLYRCKNVLISGVTVVNSPSWNIHPVLCENVCIDGVTITAPANSPNTDGIDPDSCKDVRIANCSISVGDDCIIIKSGYKYDERGVACENVAVTNCIFGHGHCGVGVGSETSGGVKNITISNCVCDGTDRGLRFKTARGRGKSVENVRASSLVMRNVEEAVTVTMFYTGGDRHTAEPVNSGTPVFRNFHLSEIVATGAKRAALIEGLAEMPIEELTISNMVVDGAAAGIACINVNGMTLDNVVVNAAKGPAVHADCIRGLEVHRVTTRKPNSAEPVLRFESVDTAVVQSCAAPQDTGTFLELKGNGNRDITLIANRLARAAREVSFTDGASETAITKRA